MRFEHYAYAFFIFALLAAFAFLCRLLFGDFKKRARRLSEREEALKTQLSSAEESAEELKDLLEEVRQETAAAMEQLGLAVTGEEPEEAGPPPESKRPKKSAGTSFKKILEYAEESAAPPLEAEEAADKRESAPARTGSASSDRAGRILELSAEGMEVARIARELKITRNEVDLVLGIHKRAR